MSAVDHHDTASSVAAPHHAEIGSYWYPDDDSGPDTAVEVLRAVRRFREADLAMRHRASADMEMNGSDLIALRHLIAAGERNEPIGPKDLSAHLGITSAATAKLLTRLESSGRLRRQRHPSDRRAQVLHATDSAHAEVREVLGAAHQRMLAAAEKLSVPEQLAVVRFLDELSGAMAEPSEEAEPAPAGAVPADAVPAGAVPAGVEADPSAPQ